VLCVYVCVTFWFKDLLFLLHKISLGPGVIYLLHSLRNSSCLATITGRRGGPLLNWQAALRIGHPFWACLSPSLGSVGILAVFPGYHAVLGTLFYVLAPPCSSHARGAAQDVQGVLYTSAPIRPHLPGTYNKLTFSLCFWIIFQTKKDAISGFLFILSL
jgi:hypothetical protein